MSDYGIFADLAKPAPPQQQNPSDYGIFGDLATPAQNPQSATAAIPGVGQPVAAAQPLAGAISSGASAGMGAGRPYTPDYLSANPVFGQSDEKPDVDSILRLHSELAAKYGENHPATIVARQIAQNAQAAQDGPASANVLGGAQANLADILNQVSKGSANLARNIIQGIGGEPDADPLSSILTTGLSLPVQAVTFVPQAIIDPKPTAQGIVQPFEDVLRTQSPENILAATTMAVLLGAGAFHGVRGSIEAGLPAEATTALTEMGIPESQAAEVVTQASAKLAPERAQQSAPAPHEMTTPDFVQSRLQEAAAKAPADIQELRQMLADPKLRKQDRTLAQHTFDQANELFQAAHSGEPPEWFEQRESLNHAVQVARAQGAGTEIAPEVLESTKQYATDPTVSLARKLAADEAATQEPRPNVQPAPPTGEQFPEPAGPQERNEGQFPPRSPGERRGPSEGTNGAAEPIPGERGDSGQPNAANAPEPGTDAALETPARPLDQLGGMLRQKQDEVIAQSKSKAAASIEAQRPPQPVEAADPEALQTNPEIGAQTTPDEAQVVEPSKAPEETQPPKSNEENAWQRRQVPDEHGNRAGFGSALDASLYDAAVGQPREYIRAMERVLQSEKDPEMQNQIRERIAIERQAEVENLRDYWSNRRIQEREDAGIEQNPEAGLRRAIGEPKTLADMTEGEKAAVQRIKATLTKRGGTNLPFGDLRSLVEDLAKLATKAIAKGRDLAAWSKDMAAQFGERVSAYTKAAWERAKEVTSQTILSQGKPENAGLGVTDLAKEHAAGRMPDADYTSELWKGIGKPDGKTTARFDPTSEAGRAMISLARQYVRQGVTSFAKFARLIRRNAGAAGEDINPYLTRLWTLANRERPKLEDMTHEEKLSTEPRVKGTPKPPIRQQIEQALFTHAAAAKAAVRDLAASSGSKIRGTMLDLEAGINRVSRIGKKVELIINHGFTDSKGREVAPGLEPMKQQMLKDNFDYESWQKYRRETREIHLSMRPGSPFDADHIMANADDVDDYLHSTDPGLVAKYDRMFNSFADAQLQLYAKYGLRTAKWVEETRRENPDYYPLTKGTIPDRMSDLNPQRVASPDTKVIHALGSDRYMDGFASMARKTELILRAGEQTRSIVPFLREAAQHPDMEGWVKDVTVEQGLAEANLRGKTSATIAAGGDPVDYMLKQLESKPREGQVPHYTAWIDGNPRTYDLNPDLWDAIRGGQPEATNWIWNVLHASANMARNLTTTYNPAFTLIARPFIHGTAATLQFGANPFRMAGALLDTLKAQWGNITPDYRAAVQDSAFSRHLGSSDFVEDSWLTDPANRTKIEEIGDKIMSAQGIKVIKPGIDAVGKVGDAIEQAIRLGFYRQMRDSYTAQGMSLADAGRRAADDANNLMNFSEAGSLGRDNIGKSIPFVNVIPQTMMAMTKGFKRNPAAFTARALMLITLPKLAEYFAYRHDPEYQRISDYAKDGSYMLKLPFDLPWPVNGHWLAVRFPDQMGVVFAGIPRRILEAIDDPDNHSVSSEIKDQVNAMSESYKPAMMPPIVAALEQLGFFASEGKVQDARFFSRSHATPGPDSNYKFAVQEADTMLGSLGRLAARSAGYFLGKEPKFPSPLQRFAPEPNEPPAAGLSGLGSTGLPGLDTKL